MTCTSSPFFSSFTGNSSFSRSAGGVLIFVNSLHLRTRPILSSHLKLHQIQPKPRLLFRLHPPSAIFSSSFAEADNGPNSTSQEDELDQAQQSGMAKAFHISSATASAICLCIAVATLTLPLAMKSLGQGVSLKIKALSYVTLLSGFYMAWNIGANDVANAMGTSVGSGALTLPQAVLTAAVLEFSGALLMGTHVTSTMQKGILVASVFKGNDTLLFAGLLSSLAAAGTWLQV